MRHYLRLSTLLPAIAGAVLSGCSGGASTTIGGQGTSSGGPPITTGTSGSNGTSGSIEGTSGGGTSGGEPPVYPTTFDTNVCTETQHKLLDGVSPSGAAPDYYALKDEYENGGNPILVAETGTKCKTAPNAGACTAALDAFRSTAGWAIAPSGGIEPGPRHRYLLVNTAAEVKAITSVAALTTFLSPIDNAKDAALLVAAEGKYRINCTENNARKTATGWEIKAESGFACGEGTQQDGHTLAVTSTGQVSVLETHLIKKGDPGCAIGRRPEGLCDVASDADTAIARFWSNAAHLEAASVVAFERLERELAELGAPDALIACARVSKDDEVRHALMTSNLAKRFGGEAVTPTVEPPQQRTAYEIALENAVEGCVRETYGALVAHYQAGAAKDPTIAAMMKAIADDETRHAGLAWDVAEWLEARLTLEERERVRSARTRAMKELHAELGSNPPDADLIELAGMPAPSQATAMFNQLFAFS